MSLFAMLLTDKTKSHWPIKFGYLEPHYSKILSADMSTIGNSSTDSIMSSSLDISTNEFENSFHDLDATIQGIIRNADTYLNSTIFSPTVSPNLLTDTDFTESSFADSLRDIDQRIAEATDRVNLMEPPQIPQQPQTVSPNRRAQRRRAASEEIVTRSTPPITHPIDHASDDDIVFVSSTILRPQFIETVDLCSPAPYRFNRRLEELVIDENVITLDDTPIPEVQVDAGSQPNLVASQSIGPTMAKKPKSVELDSSQPSFLTCPVCLEGLKGHQPQSTTCGHLYCKACIMEVLRTTHKCAICKRPLRKQNIHPIYL